MQNSIRNYATVVFDCDGVILNSNELKTIAFCRVAAPYGHDAAQALVEYHKNNGGISRYTKLNYFLNYIVPGRIGPNLEEMLDAYAQHVREGLLSCAVAPSLNELRVATKSAGWLIASGGDERELRDIFALRRLDHLFDRGIFGSPAPKNQILERAMSLGLVQFPALFLGDSRYDYEVARAAGLDFIFVHGWSELTDWRTFVKSEGILTCETVGSVASAFQRTPPTDIANA